MQKLATIAKKLVKNVKSTYKIMAKKKVKQPPLLTLKDWYQELPAAVQKETLKQLCEFLDKSERTLYNWISGAAFPDLANRKLIEQFTGKTFFYNEPIKTVKIQ
jgi:hypothetical protein